MSDEQLTLTEATERLTAPGQMFETERATVNGLEMTVWKNAPATLRQMLDLSLFHGPKDFLVYEDQHVTFEEHYRQAATLAQRLIDEGVTKGDRVAIAAATPCSCFHAVTGVTYWKFSTRYSTNYCFGEVQDVRSF